MAQTVQMTPGLATAIMTGEALYLVLYGKLAPHDREQPLYAVRLSRVAKAKDGRVTFDVPTLAADREVLILRASISTRDGPNGYREQMPIHLNISMPKLSCGDTLKMDGLYIELT